MFSAGDSLTDNENGASANKGEVTKPNRKEGTDDGAQTLGSLIKNSTDVRIQELKKEIDQLKKQRSDQMGKMRDCQRRLAYKSAEQEALAKLAEMEARSSGHSAPRFDISKLKKQRHSLEFKISTEAPSLAQEKALIRKVNELNAQIEDALKSEKMKRKRGLVAKDIEELQAKLNAAVTEITQTDAKLDDLYSNVRKILGVQRRNARAHSAPSQQRPKPQPHNAEINIEDIVVIKKRDAKPQGHPENE